MFFVYISFALIFVVSLRVPLCEEFKLKKCKREKKFICACHLKLLISELE